MNRLQALGQAAGVSPKILVSGVDDALADAMLARALAGDNADQIIAAVGRPVIQDGGTRRPLKAADGQMVLDFVLRIRRELIQFEGERRAITSKCQRLATLLEPEREQGR